MKLPVLAIAAGSIFAADWPQFRGPNGSGIGATVNPPVHWDGEKGTNILWKTPIPGLSVASPVVWGDRVYVVTAISSDAKQSIRTGLYGDTDSVQDATEHTWKVYALDRKTGKVIWDRVAARGVPKTKRHPKSSQASPSPATDGKVVIAYFGSEGLYAYSTDGKLLWRKDLGVQNAGWFFDPDSEWGAASSPVIHKNTVIVQCDRQKDSFIAAYDLASGNEVWRTGRGEIPTWGTPALVAGKDGVEVVTNGSKGIRGYDADTGKELWRLGPNSEVVCTTPVAANGLIFVTAGYPPVRPIYAVKQGARGDLTLKDGKESSESIAWSNSRAGVYIPSPIVVGDQLYTLANNGVLTAYEARTGKRLYQQRVGEGGSYAAAPVAVGGMLYLASEDGDIYVVKAGPTYELLAKNPMGEILMATPALASDVVVVRGHKHVFAISAAAGR